MCELWAREKNRGWDWRGTIGIVEEIVHSIAMGPQTIEPGKETTLNIDWTVMCDTENGICSMAAVEMAGERETLQSKSYKRNNILWR